MSTSNDYGQSLVNSAGQAAATSGTQTVQAENANGQASAAAKAASQIGSALKNAYQDRDAGLF